jgi:hypothetical protein
VAPTSAALTAAYVSSHTRQALAAAERANLIEQFHSVGQNYPLGLTQVLTVHLHDGGTGHVVEQAGPTASQENIWSYRGQLREQGLDAAGKPLFDASSTTTQTPAGSRTVLNVSGTGPGTLTGDFQWVKPTPDNLGTLRVPVPSGFAQAAKGGLPVPGINL